MACQPQSEREKDHLAGCLVRTISAIRATLSYQVWWRVEANEIELTGGITSRI